MVRRGGFGHFGAGGHERVIEELTVITRVSDHVDDAHDFSFPTFFFFFSSSSLSRSCLGSFLCGVGVGGFSSSFSPFGRLWFVLFSFCKGLKRTIFVFGEAESCCIWVVDC